MCAGRNPQRAHKGSMDGGYGSFHHALSSEVNGRSGAVSSIYIWSEIFRSPSEAKYGGPNLRRLSLPTRSFMFTCIVKMEQGD